MEPALRWAAAQVTEAEGRKPVGVEMRGELAADGIALHGKADRIDRDGEGRLAIVDYKSGGAPSAKAAFDRLDNQLGLLGLIAQGRSEEHTSELQSLMRISYAVFCLKKKKQKHI